MTTTAHEDQFTVGTQTIEKTVRQPYDTVAILRRNIADMEVALRTQTELKEKAEAELKEIQGWLVTTANNPLPYILGNQYWTKEGELVRFVAVHSAGKDHETMSDEQGVHRYTRRDFGRVTGSCHEYSDSRNTPPLYAAPVPAPHKGATHCDDCGLTWLDDGLNPLGCPYCKVSAPAPAEWRRVIDAALGLLESTTCETGVCMCGDSVIGHADFSVGHSACDSGTYHQLGVIEQLRALLQSADRLLEGEE